MISCYKFLSFHSNRIIQLFSLFTLFLVSAYVLFFRGLSYDGSFNAMAARDLFKLGYLHLPYERFDSTIIQTKLPFQLINAISLSFPGHTFIKANIANVIFYFLFWYLINILGNKYKSFWPYLGFIIVSFSPGFIELGFGGYGEFPSLVFLLSGLYLLFSKKDSNMIYGSILVTLSILTKWVFLLAMPGVLLVILLHLIQNTSRFKTFIYALITSTTIFLTTIFYEITTGLTKNPADLYDSLTYQAVYSVSEDITLWNKLLESYNSYTLGSLSTYFVFFKLLILSILIYNFVSITIMFFKNKKLSQIQLFVTSLSLVFLTYYSWWFLLGKKPWFRRIINADILLYITLSIVIMKSSLSKFINRFSIFIFLLLLISYAYLFLSRYTNTLRLDNIDEKNVIAFEKHLRAGISQLPKDYIAYGYGWWQAPRWQLVSDKSFLDLYQSFEPDCYENKDCFLFIEGENSLSSTEFDTIMSNYDLVPLFKYNNYQIFKFSTN